MKKYISESGYLYRNKNDLNNKEFCLENVVFTQGSSRFNDYRLDRSERFILFLKDFEIDTFKTKFEGIINNALLDEVKVSDSNITSELVENGYNITLEFNIKG